jgi:hypothetical protein
VNSQAQLFHVGAATHSSSGFTSSLNGGKQQPHQNTNDGDNHQEFNQCEPLPKPLHMYLYKQKSAKPHRKVH